MSGIGINKYKQPLFIVLLLVTCWTESLIAQDLEPRRWSQVPTGVNFFGVGYGYIKGDIFFDPVLRIEDASFKKQQFGLSYVRSFNMFGRSARIDIGLPYAAGRWEGLVNNEPASVRRRGLGDARFRISTLLYGGPAQTPQAFAASNQSNTVVGAAIALTMPTGEYNSERLINLGQNLWIMRPQLGVTYSRGKWTGEATIDGDAKNNPSGNWLNALSFGFPINRTQGIKLTYLAARTQKPTGADNDRLVLAYSMMF